MGDEIQRWMWLVIAVLLTVLELGHMTLLSIPFALGALAAFGLTWITDNLGYQIVTFFFVSLLATMALIPLRHYISRNTLNYVGLSAFVGRTGKLERGIPGGPGQMGTVRIDREGWACESLLSEPIQEGSTVLVKKVYRNRLQVVLAPEGVEDSVPTNEAPQQPR